MKRIVSLFMAFLLVLSAVQCLSVVSFAAEENHGSVVNSGNCGEPDADGAFGSNVTYTLYEDGTLVIDGKGDMADFSYDEWVLETSDNPYASYISLPEEYSFYVDTTVKRVEVGEGVTNIGDCAFASFIALESVSMPKNLISIGNSAFYQCYAIENLTIADGLSYIDDYAFYGCVSLYSIVIPSSLYHIGYAAFSYCSLYDVYFKGSPEKWRGMSVYGENDSLTDATIHYNYVVCDHHNTTEYAGQPSTCTDDGYSKGVFCEDCKTWISGHELIKAHHTDENDDSLCDVCGQKVKKIVDSGDCGSSGDNVQWCIYDDGTLVISGDGDMADYNDWYWDGDWDGDMFLHSDIAPFSEVYVDASSNVHDDKRITNIIIEDGVTSIGGHAFTNMGALKEVTIADSVKSIGEQSFNECSSLEAVDFGNGVESIGNLAFGYCGSLGCLQLPDSLRYIDSEAFRFCTLLRSVVLPAGLTGTGNAVFECCYMLKTVTIYNPSCSLDDNCNEVFDSGITIYGYEGSTAQEYADTFDCIFKVICEHKNTVEQEAEEASCNKDGYTQGIFCKDCNTWISGHEIIRKHHTDSNADGICDICKQPAIPIPLKSGSCGSNGSNVKWALYDGGELVISGNGAMCDFELIDGVDIWVPQVPYAEYCYSDDDEFLYEDSGIKSVVIEDGVTHIGKLAFYHFDNIQQVFIADSVTSIGEDAFFACSKLREITIPSSVKEIQYGAFDCCRRLETVVLSEGLMDIGRHSFSSCTALEEITIPASVVSIDTDSFSDCTSLKNFNVNSANRFYSAKDGVLFNKQQSTLLNYPPAKEGSEYTIPDTVHTIASSSFRHCNLLQKVVIPSSVERIEGWTFMYCDQLNSVTIPTSVKNIGCCAFEPSVRDIYYDGSYDQWSQIEIEAVLDGVRIHFGKTHPHTYKSGVSKAATCVSAGVMKYTCPCGESYTESIPATGKHTPKVSLTKATTAKDGKSVSICSVCKKTLKTVTISKVTLIKLASDKYTYDGKVKTPSVTVKDSKGKTLTNGTDYTVTYASGRKNPGQYAVKVTFKGNYSGSKMLYFTILPGVTSKIATATDSSAIKLAWKAVPGATGYRIYLFNTSTNKYTALKTTTTTSYTATKLKIGTNYKFAVKAYTTVNGETYWSAGYKTVTATALPGVTSKIVTTTSASAVKLTWKSVPGATGYRVFQYDAKTKKYVTLKTTTGTSYTVTKLKSGTSYKFAVRAYTTVNGKVFWSSAYQTVTATTNPGTPTLKATAGSKKATLSWNKQTGATGYVVYMATSQNGKYSKIATLQGNTKVSYTKTGLTTGKTYYFKVAAYTTVNGKNIYGSFSTVKAVKVK